MKRHTQASLQYFKALRQRSQNHIQRPWMRSSSVKSYNIHSELTNTYSANALNQYSSLQPKDLQPINLSFDLNGQQKSAKGKAPQQPDRDFEACARLNERKSEERNPRHSGNCYMITNGVWSYSWDGENRLTAVYSNNILLVSNTYDHQSRRIVKIISRSGAETQRRDFVYDSWNLLLELITDNGSLTTNSFTWGLDLSGTLQGAGGVGGLLAVHLDRVAFVPCFDANGNITEYIDASGTIRAHYAFDAFGNAISQSGDLALTFSYRFSTKYADNETGLVMYQLRAYNTKLGRWMTQDPIGERGGINLYLCMDNAVIDSYDFLGLCGLIVSYPSPNNPFWGGGGAKNHAAGVVKDWLFNMLDPDGDGMTKFGVDDMITQDMMSSPEVAKVRQELKSSFASGGCSEGRSVNFSRDLSNIKVEGEWRYVGGFILDATYRNRGRAVLGSFSGSAKIITCGKCSATVQFEIKNSMSWSSATRFSPSGGGYNGGAYLFDEYWFYRYLNSLKNSIPSFTPLSPDIPVPPASSIFGDNQFGQYGRNVSIILNWTEMLCF